jgi:hypothetical protein
MNTRLIALGSVVVVVVLAGCSGLIGGTGEGPAEPTETLTPVSLPERTAQSPGNQSQQPSATRFQSLRPTCERPPELVVYIQLGALRTNDPETNEGINTTWQFAAPSNRDAVGSYDRFVNLITEQYQPLLNAETLSFGPTSRTATTAEQLITVTTRNGERRSYVWYLEKQSNGRYDGCWMTTGVRSSLDSVQ